MEFDADLIPIRQAAREVGLHVDTLWRWRRAGKLQTYRVAGSGNRTFVKRSELSAVREPKPQQ